MSNYKLNKKPTLKNDIMFKYFFSKEGNEKFLQSFLVAILGKDFKIKNIIHDSHLEQKSVADKYGILDLDVELENGEFINIEMQRKDLKNIEKRVTFHAAKKISEQLSPGQTYNMLKKVIIIAILDYSFIDCPEFINKTKRVLEKHPEYKINNDVEYIYIELDKFRKENPDMEEPINQWLAFIDMERGDLLEMAEKKNKTIKEAKSKYENLTDDELKKIEEIRLFNSLEHGDDLIYERAQGEKIGKKEANINTAKYLLSIGMPINQIMEATSLSKEEIEQISKKKE